MVLCLVIYGSAIYVAVVRNVRGRLSSPKAWQSGESFRKEQIEISPVKPTLLLSF